MKRIWAPWRMEYIRNHEPGGCFLCDIIESKDDGENLVLKRADLCFAVMNRYPYNNGHLMIAPYRHADTLDAMTPEERAEMTELTNQAIRALTAAVHPHGFNIGLNIGEAAGAGLKDHIHQHIVPRWSGDTNFMPVLGETRVIPQALKELRDELEEAWKNL
jgi:ATP adenylyltransferase